MNSQKLLKTRLVKSVTLCDNEENRWHWKTSIQHRFISLSYINEKDVQCTENCLDIYVCIKDTHSPITNTDAVDLSSLALHYANL